MSDVYVTITRDQDSSLIGVQSVRTDLLGLEIESIYEPFPSVKAEYVDIPGTHGDEDYSEAFGGVRFQRRQLVINCSGMNGWDEYENLKDSLARFHGKKVNISISNQGGYYYSGRVEIEVSKENDSVTSVRISAVCDPYRRKNASGSEEIKL